MKNIICFLLFVPAFSFSVFSQDIPALNEQRSLKIAKNAIIYSLPRTGVLISIEFKRTIIKKGPYAVYANKFLGLTNVPMEDSELWQIERVECVPFNEPDPENFYTLKWKTYPENLNTLLLLNNHGIFLNDNTGIMKDFPATFPKNDNEEVIFDPYRIDETIKELTDTAYKSVWKDTAFVRIPVFKKQVTAKTEEELAKETALDLIKTRKRRIKFARGEYEYHPDASTLQKMTDEMQKQEALYLALFQGKKIETSYVYQVSIIPKKDLSTLTLGYFSIKSGFSRNPKNSHQALTVQFLKADDQPTSILQDRKSIQNMLLYRVPALIITSVMIDQDEMSKVRVPFYQFGAIQSLSLKK